MGPNFYDLIVLDIRMSYINGFKLYYQLKAINPHINILFVSALDIVNELEDELPGINRNEILKKPVDLHEFLEKIKSIIRDF